MTTPRSATFRRLRPRRPWAGFAIATAALIIGLSAPVGSPAHADQPVTFEVDGAPHISVIGDSTLSGVRWYADYGSLERFDFLLNAESCRRTIEQSCISREGYRADNVIAAMRAHEGELGEVLVVMSGYNDPLWTIDEAIAGVVEEALEQEVGTVVWLSLRTSDGVDYSDPQEQSSISTFREYNDQLFAAAEDSDGYLQIADWAAFSNGASDWFEADGVHLTPRGVDAVTTFIAGTVERVLAGENVSPSAAPWTVLVPGAEGDTVAEVQRSLMAAGIAVAGGDDGVYGYDTMAAVARYQRAVGGLQVTGAVDLQTARELGVYEAPEDEVTLVAPRVAGPDDPEPASAPGESIDDSVVAAPSGSGELPGWSLPAAGAATAGVGSVLLRRRHVVAQRARRRRARVHPSTSPHRSVADLRRGGHLPAPPERVGRVYDRAAEAAGSGPGDILSDAGR